MIGYLLLLSFIAAVQYIGLSNHFSPTKQTGKGTGLGLSLTYEMVVKGHGGSISVDSKERQYKEFTVTLPLI